MVFNLSKDKRWLILEQATEIEIEQLNISLTKRIKNWRFHPLVKKNVWDGCFTFIKQDKYIPSGLWREVYDIAKEFGYSIQLKNITLIFNNNIQRDSFDLWVEEFFKDNPIKPRDYQIDTAFKIIKYRRCMAELATSAGKTLILFIVFAYLKQHNIANKFLLIVPNVSLVIQATEDFIEYNYKNKVKYKTQQIYAGQKIKEDSDIVIGTYQSLVKKKEEYFNIFDVVMVDETHRVKSKSIKDILENCRHTDYCFGLSGTIPKRGTLDRLTLMAYTGPLISEITANFLQKNDYIAKCRVKIIQMDYIDEKTKQAFKNLSKDYDIDGNKLFTLEQKFIIENNKRRDLICKFISKLDNNALVLFHRREYGRALYEQLRNSTNKSVYYIDGSIDKQIREIYKTKMEKDKDVVLTASFGTFSTGISIKNIHYVLFTESFKSDVVIRQSIGRGLRKLEGKDFLTIVDFVDDFRYDGFENYLFKHSKERLRIYKEQKFPYVIKEVKF